MTYAKAVIIFSLLTISCSSAKFSKSIGWREKYKKVSDYFLLKHQYGCNYETDSIEGNIREFMKSEEIEKICYNRKADNIRSYKDSTITFEFNYTPFFAKKRILLFKLNSSLNIESIINQIPVQQKVKKINENYLYIVIKNPSFGQ